MDAEHQERLTFYLTGRRPATGLGAVEGQGMRPALLAPYRTLVGLRYDYPVVLVERAAGAACVESLSGLLDGLLRQVAEGEDALRLRHHGLRLEREIRRSAEAGARNRLSALWEQAGGALAEEGDALLVDSLARICAARRVDGQVAGCDRDLPARLIAHVWTSVGAQKARTMRATIDRLIVKLADILRADEASSEEGLSADRLRASMGAPFADEVDFGAMSHLLTTARPVVRLPESRRRRIARLLATLEHQAFFPAADASEPGASPAEAYGFLFQACGEAVAAYRERLPRLAALATAMEVAGLEVDGAYREGVHDALFEALGADELDPAELARFPDYLVCLRADTLTASESAILTEALSAGLPMKVLLQTDDLMAPTEAADGHASTGARVRQLAHAAIAMSGVHVVQAASSELYRVRASLVRGLEHPGPALISIYSGAGGALDGLPPYLAAAAAVESRAFPSFTYDPAAGTDWASRFSLDQNPQADRDWPQRTLTFEDASLQRVSATVAFTLVDFLACDGRYARHFARVPPEQWNGSMIPADEAVTAEWRGLPDQVPYTLVADADNLLHRVLVDRKLMREARRCREQWRILQELGGIHNSHAQRVLAEERLARTRHEAEAQEAPPAPVAAPAPVVTPAAAPPATVAEARHPDEPYIETARCSSCNECIKINDRLFKYNQNKQAYIADLSAGTYAQLVAAAESCQVAVIHPGKPTNAAEPGLEELLARAESFK